MNNPKPSHTTCDAQPNADNLVCSADAELIKARNIGDALSAALLGEYSRADALGMWAADLKLHDNQELVDRLKSEGIPFEKWESINAKVYSPNAKPTEDADK